MAGNLGTLGGLTGLTKAINTSESARNDLNTLTALSENIKRDQAESLAYQELEAQQYDEISKMASTLLEKDRNKINEKSLLLQANIREQIGQFGSRKKFFQSGGLASLKRYKSDLMNSEEVARYTDNKTNLERIFQLQVAGKGHLLAPSDLRALQDYENGQSDKIKFSGLMSEIEYPAEFYEFGKEIPDLNILTYKDNYARIYGNYITENGENALAGLDSAGIQNELLNFMKKMNYTGIGKDEFYREAREKQRLMAISQARQAATESGTKEAKAPKMSWLSSVNNLLNDTIYDKEVTVNQLLNGNYLYNVNKEEAVDYLGASNTPWDLQFKTTSTKSGMPFRSLGTMFQNKYFKPASAMKVPINDNAKLSQLTGFGTNEDGTVNYTLSTELYNANGERFAPDDVDDYLMSVGGMDLEGKAKVLGSFIGFKTEDGKILMNVVDKKGKVRKEDDNQNRAAYGKSQPKHSMFIAMQSEADDQVFYKEVDITSTLGQNQVSNVLAETDDISGTVQTRNSVKNISDKSKAIVNSNRALIMKNFNRASSENGAFGDTAFVDEVMSFKSPEGGGNRNNLVKAFYMAYDSYQNKMAPFDAERLKAGGLTGRSMFTQSLELQDASLSNDIINYDVGDTTFIKNYVTAYNNDENMTAAQKQNNQSFGELWNKYYKAILSNNR